MAVFVKIQRRDQLIKSGDVVQKQKDIDLKNVKGFLNIRE